MPNQNLLNPLLVALISFIQCTISNCQVLWAVNCGGDSHADLNGIVYQADFLEVGSASDYGHSFPINRVPEEDHIIYQTERYHTEDFSYPIPITMDGKYVLTLKFSEVWFTDDNQKVFDVYLHSSIPIVRRLDIYGKVGFATAYDHHIEFQIKDKKIVIKGHTVPIDEDYFTVDFIKTELDNPKINAIILTNGTIDDIPQLPPLEQTPPPRAKAPKPASDQNERRKHRPTRTPPASDPYAGTDFSSYILPIAAAVIAFVPILFCLCRL